MRLSLTPGFARARARHGGRPWLRTPVAPAVALALLQAAIWYVGDGAATGPPRSWQWAAPRTGAIHGLTALTRPL